MPVYEFRCDECGATAQQRRTYDAMNEPGLPCVLCGRPTNRIFSPTNNLFVPIAFGSTWSDFHDVTERELARTRPELEPANRVRSRPGNAATLERERTEQIERAFMTAKAKVDARYSAMGIPTDDA